MAKNNHLPNDYSLYDSSYGVEFPIDQYYVILFDVLPSKLSNTTTYKPDVNDFFFLYGFEKVSEIMSSNRRFDYVMQQMFVHHEKQILVKVYGSVEKGKQNFVNIEILYNVKNGNIEKQIEFDALKMFESKRKKSNISLIKTDMGHMDIEEYDLNVPDMNLELNYGKDFTKIHQLISERLNKLNDKGIILLHGDPGTGKTSYIKYLTTLIMEKEILFIPPSMAEMLSEPSIIPFLMEHKNSILIIEDAEKVISDRDINGSSIGVSNILNLTDGILGDCLNIQVIATFNMKKEKIDKALLRKGRLIAEHKFEKLSIEDSNNLLKYLNKDYNVTEPMYLSDIYNIDVEVYKSDDNSTKIGFK